MQDLRLAIRSLRATPIVTTVAIVSLALGIGANTAVFSLLNAVALKSLPITNPERLVRLSGVNAPEEGGPYSYALYDELRRHGDLFDGTAAYNCCGTATLTAGGDSQTVTRMWVSGDFFSTVGVLPEVGRMIRADDDRREGGPDGIVAVITDRLWRERFGGRLDAIGAHITVDRAPVTIVGVLPPNFSGLEVGRTIDIALPGHAEPAVMPAIPFSDDVAFLAILARLRSDRTLAATVDGLHAVQPQIRAATLPKRLEASEWLKAPLWLVSAARGTSTLRRQFERPLVALLAVAVLLLLIACANLANLLLARAVARQSELAIRVALGAGRWHIVRPLAIESTLLVIAGTSIGVWFARSATRGVTAALSTAVDRIVLDLSLDWRMLVFTAATMVVTALLFATAPALRATGVDPIKDLQARGRGVGGGRRGLSSGLLVAQVAISLVLVVVAALFMQTFIRLNRAPLGFDRDRVVLVTVTAPTVNAHERNVFYHRLVGAARELPGVAAAGGSVNPPLIGGMIGDFVVSPPASRPAPDAEAISQSDAVTPGWFSAERIAIRAGRDFNEHDTLTSEHAMIVNEAFVRQLMGGRADAVGTRLALSFRVPIVGDMPYDTRTIVGVVGDAVYRSLRDRSKPTLYLPLAQFEGPILWTSFFVSVRSQSSYSSAVSHAVADAFTALNPNLRLTFRPVAEQVEEALAQDRLVAAVSAFVGALAVLLAAIGLYGITTHGVAEQRPEIGIRLALGAPPSSVARLIASRVAVLVAVGIAIGAVISAWAARFAASLLFGISPRDPAVFTGAAVVLAVVASLAAFPPAWRASRIDPAEVLRES